MVALRAAAYEDEEDARLWTLYGVQCMRVGRFEPARQALQHAVWLRERHGERRKADVTRALLTELGSRSAA